jgi:glycosyltransferase
LDIIHKTSNLFPQCNIRIVSEVDRGIADAMNKGIVLSSGKVITHLHAGDRYIDNLVIERVIQSYCQEHWSWAVAGSVVVDKHGKILHNFKAHSDFKILLKKNCIPHQSTFLDKNIFERYGLFDLKYKQAMDYEYWLRIAFKGGERFTVLPFNTTYFLEGGRSANIFELLQYLSILRRSMRKYGCKTNLFDDLIFLFRVLAFSIVYQLKRKLYLL